MSDNRPVTWLASSIGACRAGRAGQNDRRGRSFPSKGAGCLWARLGSRRLAQYLQLFQAGTQPDL